MKPLPSLSYLSFPLLFFFFTYCAAPASANGLIGKTCRNCSSDDPNISYGFCVASLQAAPGSECAALRGLTLISMRLVSDNATSTRCFIKRLLKSPKWDPYTRGCLEDCLELYSDVVPSVKAAMSYYKHGNFNEANVEISSAITGFTTCEDGFTDRKGVPSPLTKRNNDAFHLSALVLSYSTCNGDRVDAASPINSVLSYLRCSLATVKVQKQ